MDDAGLPPDVQSGRVPDRYLLGARKQRIPIAIVGEVSPETLSPRAFSRATNNSRVLSELGESIIGHACRFFWGIYREDVGQVPLPVEIEYPETGHRGLIFREICGRFDPATPLSTIQRIFQDLELEPIKFSGEPGDRFVVMPKDPQLAGEEVLKLANRLGGRGSQTRQPARG